MTTNASSEEYFTYHPADPAELEKVLALLRLCGEELKGKYQVSPWLTYSLEHLTADAAKKEVFAVFHDSDLAASFTLSFKDKFLEARSEWISPAHRAIYGSKLATDPKYRRKGVFEWCMQRIVEEGIKRGCQTLRFQAAERHLEIIEIYGDRSGTERRGFAEVILEGQEEPLRTVLFEQLLGA